jgi:hypothetical protein
VVVRRHVVRRHVVWRHLRLGGGHRHLLLRHRGLYLERRCRQRRLLDQLLLLLLLQLLQLHVGGLLRRRLLRE